MTAESSMHPDHRVSRSLQEVAEELDKRLEEIAGTRVGFYLSVFPEDPKHRTSYVANCSRQDVRQGIDQMLRHWDEGMPVIATHEIENDGDTELQAALRVVTAYLDNDPELLHGYLANAASVLQQVKFVGSRPDFDELDQCYAAAGTLMTLLFNIKTGAVQKAASQGWQGQAEDGDSEEEG